MIRFITGRSGSGKSEMVTNEVCRLINETDRQVVVIVPEQETAVWERKLAAILPPSSNLQLEVTNFTNLARSVFREYGGLADSVIDDGSRILIMWRAMLSVWDELRVYNNLSSREDRCVPIMLRAIDELKSSGITPEKAETALEKLILDEQKDENNSESDEEKSAKKSKYGSFGDRLSDVVLVYAAYNSILHEEYIDKSDVEEKLAKCIAENPYFAGKSVFADSFLSYTSGQEKILREIIRTSENFTATVMTQMKNTHDLSENGNSTDNEMETDTNNDVLEPQFNETHETLKRLVMIANRLGKDYEAVELSENQRHKNNPGLEVAEKYVFSSDVENIEDIQTKNAELYSKIKEKQQNNVDFILCRDKLDEAKICAAAVNQLLNEGYDYNDIAVVARNVDAYNGIIDAELRQHGYNCFISKSTGVMLNPAVRFVCTLLSVVADGWQKNDILSFAKTGLVEITTESEENEEVDSLTDYSIMLFENYVNTWNINSKKSYTEDDWGMNPDGYKIGITEYGERILKIVNNVRRQIAQVLDDFSTVFDIENDGAAYVLNIAKGIVETAERIGIANGIKRISEAYSDCGMLEEAEKCESGWKIVCEILDKMVEFLGETKLDARKFLGLFKRVAQSMDVGSIPSGSNEIAIGNAQGIRLEGKKCIIILGANEGEFPGEANVGKQYFSDNDKIKLESYGIELGGDNSSVLGAREYCMFYRTVSAASDKLILLGEEKKELSSASQKMAKLISCDVKLSRDLDINYLVYDRKSAEDYLLDKATKNTREIIEKAFGSAINGDISADKDETQHDDDRIANTENNDDILYLSQTKIVTYLRCPFNYACKYEMKLKPRAVGEMTLPDIGVIIHMILQEYFTDKYRQNRNADNEKSREEKICEIVDEIRTKIEKNIDKGDRQSEYLYVRIKRQMNLFIRKLEAEIESSGFEPIYIEKKIGRGGIIPIEFCSTNGRRVIIEGIADRVDVKSNNEKAYLRIIDYKTGNKSFKMENVENGTEIQLLIYLFSILNDGELLKQYNGIKFGGAMYVSYNMSSAKIDRSNDAETALIEAEKKINFSGMLNHELDTGEKNKYIYIGENELGKIRQSLDDEIREVSDNILHKNFEKNPREIDGSNPCDWCDNAYICKRKMRNS